MHVDELRRESWIEVDNCERDIHTDWRACMYVSELIVYYIS